MKHRFRILSALTLGLSLLAQAPPSGSAPGLDLAKAQPITDQVPDDPEIAKVLVPLAVQMKAQFGRTLVEAPAAITRGLPGEENLLGYWVADLMRERAQQYTELPVPFAITNRGGLRANLPMGAVKVDDIYKLMPFENELVVAEYTGAEIIQIVKESIRKRGGEPCSGIKAAVAGTVANPVYTITQSNGSAINAGEIYRLALTDYLLTSGDNIPTLKLGRKPVLTGLTLRGVLLDACTRLGQAKTPLLAPAGGRYTYTPEIAQAIQAHALTP